MAEFFLEFTPAALRATPAANNVLNRLRLRTASMPSRCAAVLPIWIAVVFLLGAALSLLLFVTHRTWEKRAIHQQAASLVEEQLTLLEITLLQSLEILHSVASLHAAEQRIGREQFQRFVRPALERHPALRALSWNPRLLDAGRAQFESRLSPALPPPGLRELDSNGLLVSAGRRPEYVPVELIEPGEGNAPAIGYDLASDPVRRESLELARDSGQPVATAPILLAQEQTNTNRAGFLVLLPVYGGPRPTTLEERRARWLGVTVAVFRVADLVESSVARLERRGIHLQLFDQDSQGKPLHPPDERARETPSPSVAWLHVANRRWAASFMVSPQFTPAGAHRESWLMLAGGGAFSLLISAYLFSGWRRVREADTANLALRSEVAIRQRAETAAQAANSAKSDFLTSMSHEVRTPLNAILGYTHLMERDPLVTSEQRDALAGIRHSGRHLLGIINEVLDLSKIEAGRMELHPAPFDLGVLAKTLVSTLQPLCAGKRIGLRFEFPEKTSGRVEGDEGKLRQILINLLGNAIKFTQAGEVFLRITPQPANRWLFEVIDTGLGIPPEELTDIFKPFHQGSGAQHQGGTGLGLAIAQRQAGLLGGTLDLQSERGAGTRFYFEIPLPPSEPGAFSALSEQCVSATFHGDTEAPEPLPESIRLPEQLSARLMLAAELHSSTALKSALPELRELGPDARLLAEHIRRLMRSYDMEGVQRLLAQVHSRCPAAHASGS